MISSSLMEFLILNTGKCYHKLRVIQCASLMMQMAVVSFQLTITFSFLG